MADLLKLSEETRKLLAAKAQEAIDSGIPAEQVLKFIEDHSDEIAMQHEPASMVRTPVVDFMENWIKPQIEPSMANMVAMPLSFATGPLAKAGATALFPSLAKRAVVRMVSDPGIIYEAAAGRAGAIAAKYGPLATIGQETRLLGALAHSFGVGLPFGVAHAMEAEDDESQAGAFASTVATFAVFDMAFFSLGALGRSVSRFFKTRLAEELMPQPPRVPSMEDFLPTQLQLRHANRPYVKPEFRTERAHGPLKKGPPPSDIDTSQTTRKRRTILPGMKYASVDEPVAHGIRPMRESPVETAVNREEFVQAVDRFIAARGDLSALSARDAQLVQEGARSDTLSKYITARVQNEIPAVPAVPPPPGRVPLTPEEAAAKIRFSSDVALAQLGLQSEPGGLPQVAAAVDRTIRAIEAADPNLADVIETAWDQTLTVTGESPVTAQLDIAFRGPTRRRLQALGYTDAAIDAMPREQAIITARTGVPAPKPEAAPISPLETAQATSPQGQALLQLADVPEPVTDIATPGPAVPAVGARVRATLVNGQEIEGELLEMVGDGDIARVRTDVKDKSRRKKIELVPIRLLREAATDPAAGANAETRARLTAALGIRSTYGSTHIRRTPDLDMGLTNSERLAAGPDMRGNAVELTQPIEIELRRSSTKAARGERNVLTMQPGAAVSFVADEVYVRGSDRTKPTVDVKRTIAALHVDVDGTPKVFPLITGTAKELEAAGIKIGAEKQKVMGRTGGDELVKLYRDKMRRLHSNTGLKASNHVVSVQHALVDMKAEVYMGQYLVRARANFDEAVAALGKEVNMPVATDQSLSGATENIAFKQAQKAGEFRTVGEFGAASNVGTREDQALKTAEMELLYKIPAKDRSGPQVARLAELEAEVGQIWGAQKNAESLATTEAAATIALQPPTAFPPPAAPKPLRQAALLVDETPESAFEFLDSARDAAYAKGLDFDTLTVADALTGDPSQVIVIRDMAGGQRQFRLSSPESLNDIAAHIDDFNAPDAPKFPEAQHPRNELKGNMCTGEGDE